MNPVRPSAVPDALGLPVSLARLSEGPHLVTMGQGAVVLDRTTSLRVLPAQQPRLRASFCRPTGDCQIEQGGARFALELDKTRSLPRRPIALSWNPCSILVRSAAAGMSGFPPRCRLVRSCDRFSAVFRFAADGVVPVSNQLFGNLRWRSLPNAPDATGRS